MRSRPKRAALIGTFLITNSVPLYAGDFLPFPPPPATAAGAATAASFDARAEKIIHLNACGREDEYLRIRAAMRGGDFRGQGEDLACLLIAKLAWVRTHSSQQVCFEQRGNIALSGADMIRQVNESIRAMKKTGQMGTNGLNCVESLKFDSEGDWDVNVRELVRILYLARTPGVSLKPRECERPSPPFQAGGSLLESATIEYMYTDLLTATGKPSPNSYSQLGDCSAPAGDELGTPEDRADRHAWYNELFDSIGDFFKWLISLPIKAAGSGISSAVGLFGWPFLLAAGDDPLPMIAPHWDVRIPETENHRLMIETSRFLTNADMIARLEAKGYDYVEDIKDEQVEVRNWLLFRLQQIAAHDFDEYNARPYSRYSLEAVMNLHDFVSRETDPALQKAARIVLDLSVSKFAAESNRGRRIVPFRRLSQNDGADKKGDLGDPGNLYNKQNGGDHEVARAMVLFGQTQLLPSGIPLLGAGVLVNTATSSYCPPLPAFQAAVEPVGLRTQTMIINRSVAKIVRSGAFTISAGGLRSGPTLSTLGVFRNEDCGVAMPTVIIPTSSGTRLSELFRYKGVGTQHERTENLCVHSGFACGIAPELSTAFNCVETRGEGGTFRFINSAACLRDKIPVPGPHFYFASRTVACNGKFCPEGESWGLSEIVDAPRAKFGGDPEFDRFILERTEELTRYEPDDSGRGTYVATNGTRIEYTVAVARPEILAVNGSPTPNYETQGDFIEADGKGRATIKGANSVIIDFSDWTNPKRIP